MMNNIFSNFTFISFLAFTDHIFNPDTLKIVNKSISTDCSKLNFIATANIGNNLLSKYCAGRRTEQPKCRRQAI